MSRKYWTTRELEIIDSGLYTSSELAEMFEVKQSDVQNIGKNYKLNYKKMCKKWSKQDEQELLELLKRRCPKSYICQKLGRSINSINNKLRELDMPRYRLWTTEEEQVVIDNYYYLTFLEISKLLDGRTHISVRRKVQNLQKQGVLGKDKTNIGNPKFGREIWRMS